jgi:hypothetical protein
MPIQSAENQEHKRMWPSLETASRVADFANAVFISSLVFGVLASGLIVWMANVKEAHWDALRRASEEKIAEAGARQKEAELKLEQMRRLSAPRNLDLAEFQNNLIGKPKAPVTIWYLPDSSDGYWFASQLRVALAVAGWPVSFPAAIPDFDEKVVEALYPSPGILLSILRGTPRAVNAGGNRAA